MSKLIEQFVENGKMFAHSFSNAAFALAMQAGIIACTDGASEMRAALDTAFGKGAACPGHLANTKTKCSKGAEKLSAKYEEFIKEQVRENPDMPLAELGQLLMARISFDEIRSIQALEDWYKGKGKFAPRPKEETKPSAAVITTDVEVPESAPSQPVKSEPVAEKKPEPLHCAHVTARSEYDAAWDEAHAEEARRTAAAAEAKAAYHRRLIAAGQDVQARCHAFATLANELGIKLTKAQLAQLDALEQAAREEVAQLQAA